MEKLTQSEEEAMQAVWKCNGGYIKDFLEGLPGPRPPYTTLASTIKNLEKKGFLTAEKVGNTYRYAPRVGAEEYKRGHMRTFVSEYFKNSYKELVSFFAREQQISAEEFKEIIDMIENKKSK
jgi:predicted transcriptional regulator